MLANRRIATVEKEIPADEAAIIYKSVIDAAIDAVIIFDEEGVIREYNPAARDIFGYPEAEIVGSNVAILIPDRQDDTGEDRRHPFLDMVRAGFKGFHREFSGRRCDGTLFPTEVSVHELTLSAYRLYICTMRDITDRVTTNQLIRHYTNELKRSNQALQQFAYVASHDLQEPLRVIASYAELLGRRYQGRIDDKADKFLGYIIEGTNRLQDMIRGILAYARVDTQGKVLQPVNTDKVLRWALQNLARSIQQHQADITHDSMPEVLGDDTQLGQVFQNLIGNAIKYRRTDSAPVIHIGVSRLEMEWLFAVQDNGIGIEDKFIERVFEIFQRVHDGNFVKGNGIGLTITRKIIERHGGRIWVESALNSGSTFYFTLKAKEPAA